MEKILPASFGPKAGQAAVLNGDVIEPEEERKRHDVVMAFFLFTFFIKLRVIIPFLERAFTAGSSKVK